MSVVSLIISDGDVQSCIQSWNVSEVTFSLLITQLNKQQLARAFKDETYPLIWYHPMESQQANIYNQLKCFAEQQRVSVTVHSGAVSV